MVVRISDKMHYYSKVTKLLVKPRLKILNASASAGAFLVKLHFVRAFR